MTMATPHIRQVLDPARWSEHHFGLPDDRCGSGAARGAWLPGAGPGYGRSRAAALAAAGARVFLSGRRLTKLQETLMHLRELAIPTDRCEILPCDITDPVSVSAAGAAIAGKAGALHGLVNNAALPSPGGVHDPLASMDPTQWRALLETNVTGPLLGTKTAPPFLLGTGSARRPFVSSGASLGVHPRPVARHSL